MNLRFDVGTEADNYRIDQVVGVAASPPTCEGKALDMTASKGTGST